MIKNGNTINGNMNTINGNMAKGFDNEKENKFDTNRLLIRDLLDIDKNGKIEGKE